MERRRSSQLFNCCTELQKWPEAEKILRTQLALRGELPGIKFLLGRVILSAGRASEALTILHEASKLAKPDSDLLRDILDWQRKAMDAGANIVASKPPVQATEISRQELEAALDEFAFQVSAQHRMKFWRKKETNVSGLSGLKLLLKLSSTFSCRQSSATGLPSSTRSSPERGVLTFTFS